MRYSERGSAIALVLLAAVLGAACSGGGEPAEGATEAPEPPSGPVASPTGSTGTGSELEERTEATLELDFPDRILVGFGSIWIKTDDQRELRIDPATNEVIAEVPLLGSSVCQGTGMGKHAVWGCAETRLVRIDPDANAIDLETDVQVHVDQWAIGVGEGAAWPIALGGEELVAVDERTGKERDRFELGRICENTAVGFGTVWVTCNTGDVVLAVDAATGDTREIPLAEPLEITTGPDAVWVGTTDPAGGVARIDPATLRVDLVAGTAGPGNTGSIWVDGSDVWVRSSGVFLTRIDASNLSVVEELPSPEPLGGGAVAVGFGSVWASSYDFFRVLRIRP
jgi:streptogramin lyase